MWKVADLREPDAVDSLEVGELALAECDLAPAEVELCERGSGGEADVGGG